MRSSASQHSGNSLVMLEGCPLEEVLFARGNHPLRTRSGLHETHPLMCFGPPMNERLSKTNFQAAPAAAGNICVRRVIQLDQAKDVIESDNAMQTNVPLPSFTPLLKRQKTLDEPTSFVAPKCDWVVPNSTDYPSYSLLKHLASEVQCGLRVGYEPALADMSVGGAYFMRNRLGRIAAVFKPLDEEAYAPNNPREYIGSGLGMKNGIPAGEAGIREAAVFIIDNGFSGVAPTVMVKVQCRTFKNVENKEGSLQQYVRHIGCSDDYGPSKFSTCDAHRIMLLDIRTCNQDRHAGNILVSDGVLNGRFIEPTESMARNEMPMPSAPFELRRSHSVGPSLELVRPVRRPSVPRKTDVDGLSLIPIDHGFALPHPFAIDETEFCWMFWPQAKVPLSKELKDYVARLDVDEDIARVKAALGDALPSHCYLTLRIGTALLKIGVARGLTLYEIGLLIVRDNMDRPSRLEDTIEEVRSELSKQGVPLSVTSERDHGRFMDVMVPALTSLVELYRERRVLLRSSSA